MISLVSLIYNRYTVTIVALLLLTWLSRVIYSLYFSPLSKIPSPLVYQFFPWYYNVTLARGNTPFILDRLHKEYGPIFRVGWEVVIVIDPDACSKIYSSYAFAKGKFYNSFNYFGNNLLSECTRHGHALRKRLVAPAFTKANVKLMEPVSTNVGLIPLINNVDNHIKFKKPVDLFHQFHYMSWDIIGELGLGQSFGMLKDGNHPVIDWLSSTLIFIMLYNIFPFLTMFKISAAEKLRKFNNEALDKYYEKLNDEKAEDSLLRFLVNAKDNITGNKLTRQDIFAETSLMLFAGTDTTSNSLTLLFYLLMKHPDVEAKLASELGELNMDIITYEVCRDQCPYLNAVVKETMRLLPAVPGANMRHVPDEGATFLGHRLPAGTQVGVPLYAIQRSELIWPRANEFLPERWLETDPTAELYVTPTMQKCFTPFLIGPTACVGKNLANQTINIVTANLIKRYQFLPHGSDQSNEMELVALPVFRPRQCHMTVNVVPRLKR